MDEKPQSPEGSGKIERKPRDQYVLLAVIGVIVLLLVVIPVARFASGVMKFGRAGDKELHEADDGFIKARQSINPEELRQWVLGEMAQRPPKVGGLDGTNIPMAEIPGNIYGLYPVPPGEVTAFNDKGLPYICFAWGSGLFHWMIVVGPTNYTEPTGVWTDYTTALWTNGIYYSREDTAHPIP